MSMHLEHAEAIAGSVSKKFDREKLKQIYNQRKSDYQSLNVFACQPGVVPDKKMTKRAISVETNWKYHDRSQRAASSVRSPSERSGSTAPSRRSPQSLNAYMPTDSTGSSVIGARGDWDPNVDPYLFVIGSTPLRNAHRKRTPKNTPPKTPLRKGEHKSLNTPKITIRNSGLRSAMRTAVSAKRSSNAGDLDADLLETTDDEDNIYHEPFPFGRPTRAAKGSRHNKSGKSTQNVETASGTGEALQASCAPRCGSCRSSVLRWVANKICRAPVVKHK